MNCPEFVWSAGPPGRKLDGDGDDRAQSPKQRDDESPRRGKGQRQESDRGGALLTGGATQSGGQ
jgi:hypothetical protein